MSSSLICTVYHPLLCTVPPSKLEYNFTFPLEKNIDGEVGQPLDVDRIVFGGKNSSTVVGIGGHGRGQKPCFFLLRITLLHIYNSPMIFFFPTMLTTFMFTFLIEL